MSSKHHQSFANKKIEHKLTGEKHDLAIKDCHEHHGHEHHGHEHHGHEHHGHEHHGHEHHGHEHHGHEHENHKQKALIGILFGLATLAFSFISLNIPLSVFYFLNSSSALLTIYLGSGVYQSAWHSLKNKKLSMATLYAISTLTILGISMLSLFVHDLPLMLESAPLILGFWHLGETIEHSLLAKINEKLNIRDCAPKKIKMRNHPDKMVSVKKLIPNDIIILEKGNVLPVDGLLNQPAFLYTTRVDGSPNLKHFNAGDAVKAGMSLASHSPAVEVCVTKTYKNSYLSLIAKNISKANQEKAPIEMFANKILKYFVPGLAFFAITSGILVGLYFTPALGIQSFISILVSACPCALSLITPMAVKIGMNKASEKGVHFKHGKALQAAADINAVVFDLNGTLTQGKTTVKRLMIQDKSYLKHFAKLEGESEHPISKTIIDYIKQEGIEIDQTLLVSSIDKSHHAGIKGDIKGHTFMIGNMEMLRSNGVTNIAPPYHDPKNGTLYMVRDKQVIGQIAISDCLRSDAIKTVQQLKLMGKQVYICTGADKATAEEYAKLLGIPFENISTNTIGATTTPNEFSKESYIKSLQDKGLKVAMVGDAANDLTAIASANIGIAVKSSIGDTLTVQHAEMVIQEGSLFPIATAFDVSAKAKSNIYQNLIVSLGYNSLVTLVAAGLFLPLGIILNPAIGVALMVLESAIVLANLYRLKLQKSLVEANNNQQPDNQQDDSNPFTTELASRLNHKPCSMNIMQEVRNEDFVSPKLLLEQYSNKAIKASSLNNNFVTPEIYFSSQINKIT